MGAEPRATREHRLVRIFEIASWTVFLKTYGQKSTINTLLLLLADRFGFIIQSVLGLENRARVVLEIPALVLF
jgi:hypothetical protein